MVTSVQSFLQKCVFQLLLRLYLHLLELLCPIEWLPVLHEAGNGLLLVIHGFVPPATVHVLPWQAHHPSHDIQSKTSAEIGLVVYHMDESTVQPKLYVEVGKVLWDDLPQVTACRDKLLHLMLGPFFFSFIDCLNKTK